MADAQAPSSRRSIEPPEVRANGTGVSTAFTEARRKATALPLFPGSVPETMDEAYAIQDRSITQWQDRIAGWKIGLVPEGFRAAAGTDRLAGPIFSRLVRLHAPDIVHAMPVFEGGFAAIEAEFVFRLATDIPASGPAPDLKTAAGALHVGVEIASSPFPGINDLGPMSVVSDFGNNNGLILGPEIPGWRDKPWESMPASVEIDGRIAGEATAASLPGAPLAALEFLVALLRRRGLDLKAGDLVSTGAATGVHEAPIGARSRVDFGPYGAIELVLIAALGRTARPTTLP